MFVYISDMNNNKTNIRTGMLSIVLGVHYELRAVDYLLLISKCSVDLRLGYWSNNEARNFDLECKDSFEIKKGKENMRRFVDMDRFSFYFFFSYYVTILSGFLWYVVTSLGFSTLANCYLKLYLPQKIIFYELN